MRKIHNYLMIGLKGACMGAADVIPGVSGGTIAFIMGIYDEFVGSIAKFDTRAVKLLFKGHLREFWKHINGGFLLSIILGIGTSVICLAGLMQMLLSDHPIQTWAFFFGLIVASSLFILRGIEGWKTLDFLLLAFGIVLGVVICTLSPVNTPDAWWFIFLSGALAICAMILPGISGSFILLILGKYQYIMGTISNCIANIGAAFGSSGADSGLFWSSLATLAVFLVGACFGILAFSKFLHWLLGRWHKETLVVLAGFIIGSLVKVWPWNNMEAIVCSQFPEVASLAESLDGPLPEELISQYAGSADMHIWGAVIFALIGFSLVTGIEIIGKIITKRK